MLVSRISLIWFTHRRLKSDYSKVSLLSNLEMLSFGAAKRVFARKAKSNNELIINGLVASYIVEVRVRAHWLGQRVMIMAGI